MYKIISRITKTIYSGTMWLTLTFLDIEFYFSSAQKTWGIFSGYSPRVCTGVQPRLNSGWIAELWSVVYTLWHISTLPYTFQGDTMSWRQNIISLFLEMWTVAIVLWSAMEQLFMAKEEKRRPISSTFSTLVNSLLTSFYIIPIHLTWKSNQVRFSTQNISNWDFWFRNILHIVRVFNKWHFISEPTFSTEMT